MVSKTTIVYELQGVRRKRYQCPECGRLFKGWPNMLRHRGTHPVREQTLTDVFEVKEAGGRVAGD